MAVAPKQRYLSLKQKMLSTLLSISLLITINLSAHSEALAVINKDVLQIQNCKSIRHVTVGQRFAVECRYNKLSKGNHRLRLEFEAQGKTGDPRTLMSSDKYGIYQAPWIEGSEDAIVLVYPKYLNQSNGYTAISREARIEYSGIYTCEAFEDSTKFGRRILYKDSCEVVVGHKPRYVYVTTHYNKNVAKNKPMVKKLFRSTDQEISGRCSTPEPHTSMTVKINGRHKTEIYDLDNKTKVFLINIKKNPELYDGATIECKARNDFGSVTNESRLSVLYPPRADLIKVNGRSFYYGVFYLHRGEKLNCTSKGNPQPQTTWLSPNLTLFRQTHPNVLVTRNILVTTTVELVCEATQGKKAVRKLFQLRFGTHVNETTKPSTEFLTTFSDNQWKIIVAVSSSVIFVLFSVLIQLSYLSVNWCTVSLDYIMTLISTKCRCKYDCGCLSKCWLYFSAVIVFVGVSIYEIAKGSFICYIYMTFCAIILIFFTLLELRYRLWKLSKEICNIRAELEDARETVTNV